MGVDRAPRSREWRPDDLPLRQIGSGAKVMGEIEVGANARVGTNAVVLEDVPPNTTVVGMPARPVTD